MKMNQIPKSISDKSLPIIEKKLIQINDVIGRLTLKLAHLRTLRRSFIRVSGEGVLKELARSALPEIDQCIKILIHNISVCEHIRLVLYQKRHKLLQGGE